MLSLVFIQALAYSLLVSLFRVDAQSINPFSGRY
jgi:hypothetical protein